MDNKVMAKEGFFQNPENLANQEKENSNWNPPENNPQENKEEPLITKEEGKALEAVREQQTDNIEPEKSEKSEKSEKIKAPIEQQPVKTEKGTLERLSKSQEELIFLKTNYQELIKKLETINQQLKQQEDYLNQIREQKGKLEQQENEINQRKQTIKKEKTNIEQKLAKIQDFTDKVETVLKEK